METIAQFDVAAATDLLKEKGGQFAELGINFAIALTSALLLLFIGWLLARWVSRTITERLSTIEKVDKTLVPFLAQISRFAVWIIVGILALAQMGIQTTSIITILGAAGLAIGLALQGTLQNVAAGIMLLIIRPFKVGDYIEVAGAGGTVDAIGLFMTRMHTPQNIFIAVPNSNIWSDTITNYSMRPRRRLDLLIGISYDDDIDKAVKVLKTLIEDDDRFFKRPEPLVIVKNLGDSSVDLEIRAWTKRQAYWDVRFDTIRAVKYALDNAGISIPYPHRQIVMTEGAESVVQDNKAA